MTTEVRIGAIKAINDRLNTLNDNLHDSCSVLERISDLHFGARPQPPSAPTSKEAEAPCTLDGVSRALDAYDNRLTWLRSVIERLEQL